MPQSVFFADDIRKLDAGREIGEVAENMCMAINHTGHDEGIGEIDDLHSLRRRGRRCF